jgi:hypothetical protein
MLAKRVALSPTEAKLSGTGYNAALINALVLYIGATVGNPKSPLHAAAMEVYMRLVGLLLCLLVSWSMCDDELIRA